jgi:hypothetical protein
MLDYVEQHVLFAVICLFLAGAQRRDAFLRMAKSRGKRDAVTASLRVKSFSVQVGHSAISRWIPGPTFPSYPRRRTAETELLKRYLHHCLLVIAFDCMCLPMKTHQRSHRI